VPRHCFVLQVRPELLDEYRERHAAVWPEMLEALAATGWGRYAIFARDDGMLIGYVECDDLDRARAAMAATDVNTRWQAEMARYFDLGSDRPDEAMTLLDPIFDLDQQLRALAPPHQR
jgi:L-rhamnose mutarotase